MLIYLVGARGSGKTTVGKALALANGWPFLDLDAYIGQKAGREIAAIVAAEGWDAFRQLEARCLREASARLAGDTHAVIATGGGAVLAASNRAHMRASGLVIWLRASEESLLARLAKEPLAAQRPSLTGLSPQEEMRRVLAEREGLYAECAHHALDANASPENICLAIRGVIEKSSKKPADPLCQA